MQTAPMAGRGGRLRTGVVALSLAVLALQGCAGGGIPGMPGGSGSSGSSGTSVMGTVVTGLGCLVGAAGGAVAARALATRDRSRMRMTDAQFRERERGYLIALGLVGCAGGGVLANTVYGKLSDAGRRDRERALQEAAQSGQVQRYGDPSNARVSGTVTPSAPAVEGAEECVTSTDAITDGASRDSIPVKFCRRLGSNDPYTMKTA